MKTVWYVHGANSSPVSFNYITSKLPKHTSRPFSYGPEESLDDISQRLVEAIQSSKGKVSLIGHSLGGIVAFLAAFGIKDKVDKIVTMSTPFGGVKYANTLKMFFPKYLLLKQLHTGSDHIHHVLKHDVIVPTLTLISTSGHVPLIAEPNDGVVEISSQAALRNATAQEIELNHFEILLSPDTVKHIRKFIF